MIGCKPETGSPSAASTKNDTLLAAYNKLKGELSSRDSLLSFFSSTMNSVQQNVLLIREKQAGLKKASKSAIMSNLRVIDSIMVKNREMIRQLQSRMGRTGTTENSTMGQFVSTLNEMVDDKSKQIDELLTDMESMNKDFGQLYEKFREVSKENDEKTRKLSKAWFTSGTEQELIAKGVVSKEGGVLGIGSSSKLSDAFNKANFEEVNINEFKSLKVQAKKAKIITTHPGDSYNLTQSGGETLIYISNPEKFWNASKFLVVLIQKK